MAAWVGDGIGEELGISAGKIVDLEDGEEIWREESGNSKTKNTT